MDNIVQKSDYNKCSFRLVLIMKSGNFVITKAIARIQTLLNMNDRQPYKPVIAINLY